MFEAGNLIGLEAEGEGAFQFVEAEGDLDDAGKIEAGAAASLHQLASHLENLFTVVLDVAKGTKQKEEAGQGVDADKIDHLLTAFCYSQDGEKLLDMLRLPDSWEEEECNLLTLNVVECRGKLCKRLVGKR